MISHLPRHGGKAFFAPSPPRLLPCALLPCLLLSGAVAGLLSLPAQARPAKRPLKRAARAVPPLAPVVSGRAASPVQTLLVRDTLFPMGKNNGVRLWVRGDGGGANLRVRVLAPSRAASPAADPLPRDEWISTPIPITFTGWREFVLPQEKFSRRTAPALAPGLDLALPAVAQPGGLGDPVATVPDWASADGVALDVTTSRQTTLAVDDIAWTTLDAGGQGTASTTIADFEQGNVGAWQAVGTDQENAAVRYGVETGPGLVHGGRVAFRLTVTPPGLDRRAQLRAAQSSLRVSGKPYLIWLPESTLTPILPDSLPPTVGTSPEVTLSACPEQTQAATFCLYSAVPLSNVSVSLPQDLQGIGKTIPKANVEVHVVKVRERSGSGPLRDPNTAGAAPEVLVKDDRVPLSGAAPAVRLTGPAVCDIPADTSKQFWLTVSVPRNTPSGTYVGRLLVSGRGLPAPFTVRALLSVLPLRLLSPAKQYGIDLRSRLDPAPETLPSADGRALVTDFVSKDTLDRQLADIAAHGFTIASLYDSPATLFDAVTEYRNYGLGTPYNLYKGDGDPRDIEKQRGGHNAPVLTYYSDPEPNAAAMARMGPLSKAGIPNATYIPRQSDYQALSSSMDIAVYSRDSEYPQQLLRNKGQRVSMIRDWWYWPATSDGPKVNRASAGLLLWRSGLYGAFLPDYQTAFGSDPYDQSSAGAVAAKAAFRPQMLTYPAQGGVLDTVGWEACREGVTDVRYLTTMYAALRECKDARIAKPLVAEAETYVKAFLDKPLANLPDAQYDLFRAGVAARAIKLRAAVDTYNKAHGLR